ncbi:MAG: NifB/NifX family molybdenum-iron cluster-binding protein [Candidatus Marinimicrobia bacterium]|nr:NifB/NifX family molybdenum-iron cluster-binding protein [Candidatus Neomarinimicrobiota bacterium]
MKIAFTAKGPGWEASVDPRFGRTEYLVIFDEEKDELTTIDNRDIQNESHGAGPKTSQILLEQKVQVLVTGNGPGGNAATVLERGKVETYIGAGDTTVREAYDKFKKGELTKF